VFGILESSLPRIELTKKQAKTKVSVFSLNWFSKHSHVSIGYVLLFSLSFSMMQHSHVD
jgi:hypothetical protein